MRFYTMGTVVYFIGELFTTWLPWRLAVSDRCKS